jgi:hypothetical protein
MQLWLRVSAQAYNQLEDYLLLADALQTINQGLRVVVVR